MVFGWNAVQDLSGCRLRWIEVSCGYHKGGSSQIFAKFSHHYSTHHVNVYFPATSQFLLWVFWLPECDFSLHPINVWVVLGQPVIAYSVDQLFLTSHFVSEELSFHSSQHWSILHENWWKSTAFDHSINVSDCFCLLWSNENFSFQKLATHTS